MKKLLSVIALSMFSSSALCMNPKATATYNTLPNPATYTASQSSSSSQQPASMVLSLSGIASILKMSVEKTYDYRLVVNLANNPEFTKQFIAQRTDIIQSLIQVLQTHSAENLRRINTAQFSLPSDCSLLNEVLKPIICQIEAAAYDSKLTGLQKQTLLQNITSEAIRLFSASDADYLRQLQSIPELRNVYDRESRFISKLFHNLIGTKSSQYQWTSKINYNNPDIIKCLERAMAGDKQFVMQYIADYDKIVHRCNTLQVDPQALERAQQVFCVLNHILNEKSTEILSQIRNADLNTAEALYAQCQKNAQLDLSAPSGIQIHCEEGQLPRPFGFSCSQETRVADAARSILEARDDYQKKYSLGKYKIQSTSTIESHSISHSSSSSSSTSAQQQAERIARTTDMTTDATFSKAYNALLKTECSKMHTELYKQIMFDVYQQMQKDEAFISRESVNAWIEGLSQKYNEFTDKHSALINDIKLFAVACYLSGLTNVVIAAIETVPVVAEFAMARGATFASKLASKLAADSEVTGAVRIETEKPLDYAHSAVQYEKLKDALKIQEDAKNIQTFFSEIRVEKTLFSASTKQEALKNLEQLQGIPSKIREIITESGSFQDFSFCLDESNNYLLSMTKPGKVPGSKAIYYNKVSSTGTRMEMFKDTFDNCGKFVHRKFKN